MPCLYPGFFSTDASDVGFGGFLSGLSFSIPWDLAAVPKAVATLPPAVRRAATKLWPRPDTPQWADVAYRELFALVWAVWLWGHSHLANHDTTVAVTVLTDNNVILAEINNFGSRNVFRMALLRAPFSRTLQPITSGRVLHASPARPTSFPTLLAGSTQ
jgi:hypothetical protein